METTNPQPTSGNSNPEIVFYQPNETISFEVRLDQDTVWLTQTQMSELFGTVRSAITYHINNIFKEKELSKDTSVKIFDRSIIIQHRPPIYYNLDVIISVGYRVKSSQGTRFRQWATKLLKDRLLRQNSIDTKFEVLQNQIRIQDNMLRKHEEQISFFIRTSLPPIEGIFCDGQIFDAYVFVSDKIRSANRRVILIDNYIDESILKLMDKRKEHIEAIVYTQKITDKLQQDIAQHDAQYPHIEVITIQNIHDRFLIIDNDVFHIGASIKDLGKKLFAFSKMELPADKLLELARATDRMHPILPQP